MIPNPFYFFIGTALIVTVLAVTTHIDYINTNKWCLSDRGGIIECYSTRSSATNDAKNHQCSHECFVYPRIESKDKFCVADEFNVYECYSNKRDATEGLGKYCWNNPSPFCQVYRNDIPYRQSGGCLITGSLREYCFIGLHLSND